MSVSRPTCDPSSSHLLTAHRTSAGSRRAACGRTRPRHAALIGYRPHPVEIERSRTGPGLAAGDTFSCPGRTLPVLLSTQRPGRYAADHPTLGVVAQHDPSGSEEHCAHPGVPLRENWNVRWRAIAMTGHLPMTANTSATNSSVTSWWNRSDLELRTPGAAYANVAERPQRPGAS